MKNIKHNKLMFNKRVGKKKPPLKYKDG